MSCLLNCETVLPGGRPGGRRAVERPDRRRARCASWRQPYV